MITKLMMERKFYKILLWKAYFDKGFGLLNYLKYLIAVVGVGAIFQGVSLKVILFWGFVYAVLCFALGKIWLKYGLYDIEQDISNHFNPFAREVRHHISKQKNI